MERFFKGIPGSGGIAIGEAVVILKSNIIIPRYTIDNKRTSIESEIEKLENALAKTKKELEELKNQLILSKSSVETGYLDTTILMLDDPVIRQRVTEKIHESYLNIEWVFNEVIHEMADKLEDSDIHYFKERAPDLISIGHKVLKNLLGSKDKEPPEVGKNTVIVAHTLSPPEVVDYFKKNVKAFVTEIGGPTSHVAIMARDLKIPAVIGISDITLNVATGDSIIVDGTIGTVAVNPEEDTLRLYRHKEEGQKNYEKILRRIEKKACVLKEGIEVNLFANMDLEEELDLVKGSGCRGIGLFRTEYIFFNRNEAPDEEDQYRTYQKVVRALYPNEVTIRIIDIGGDKKPPYMHYYEERNPFLGLRGIRYALVHKELLKTQIKAILRAACDGNVRLMIPMVNDIDELLEVKRILKSCEEELRSIGVQFKGDIPTGIMIETPASVILLDRFAGHIDFISVGTNDLIQYTLAIDRGNGMVASQLDPIHPAILRSLKSINDTAKKCGLDISICGEMAGNPLYSLLLIGLGYTKLSMSSMIIPVVKDIIIHSSMEDARSIASRCLEFSLKTEIGNYLRDEMIRRFKHLEDYFR